MQYAEFFEQYKRVHQDWSNGTLNTAAAADEITRLHTFVNAIEPAEKRAAAELQIADFEHEMSPESQQRMVRACNAIADGCSDDGTVAEQIARAERSLVTVTSIANESDNVNERYAILSMNEMLGTIISELKRRPPLDQDP